MNKIYTVHAYRWGNRENHSYSVGVYTRKFSALKCALKEEQWRGEKYECEVLEWVPNLENENGSPGTQYKIVKRLEIRL